VGVKHKLLATPPEKVPHEFAQEVIDFCKPIADRFYAKQAQRVFTR